MEEMSQITIKRNHTENRLGGEMSVSNMVPTNVASVCHQGAIYRSFFADDDLPFLASLHKDNR